MIVYNSSERVIVAHYVKPEFKMEGNKKVMIPSDPAKHHAFFDFIPGNNLIDKEEWALIKEHPDFESHLESETLQVVVDKDNKNGLLNLSKKQAIKIIKNTFDEALIILWKKTEERPELLKAMDEQLESLKVQDSTKGE